MADPPDKNIDDAMEEYDRVHNIPVDITDSVSHDDFVAGVRDGSIGFKVRGGQAISLVKGGRKTIFNLLVMLYLFAPAIIVPFWAYHEGNWWLLLGIIVASLIAPQFAQRRGHSIGALLLIACVVLWFSAGFHNCFTFFSLCAFWGYLFFQIAEAAQTDYATQSLVENSELFTAAIADGRILIVRRRGP